MRAFYRFYWITHFYLESYHTAYIAATVFNKLSNVELKNQVTHTYGNGKRGELLQALRPQTFVI